ncbi:glutamyl-tRNA synthetase [Emericellopsis cladophorae]|uniref:glutamate--tRNA ligase n=1 Tax=Emericellopsis cladophorae TaxID=2686198 RepID=A0A9P9Y186_9HYPO|nr:glutamyl-tRNA synthetase [Emericellopsis cladophorae]KAI6781456.1 glutamyl-tRNA synthetase [Emericellopsis cladophorae]
MGALDIETLVPAIVAADFKTLEPHLLTLEKHLTLRTYIAGYDLSDADKKVWSALRNNKVAIGLIRKGQFASVTRWFNHIEQAHPEVKEEAVPKPNKNKGGANYNIPLPNAENGVVTRFPPEPSGYMHIGHTKAALLNDYFANEAFDGKMILRFDDTNPSKEKQEYQDSIVEDTKNLGVKIDRITHTSDYFKEIYEHAEKLIKSGNAYADDTEPEIQKEDRMNRRASKCRDRPAEESLAMLEEMKNGTDLGRKHCIRARIQFDSSNGAMRDPIIYRFPNWADKEPAPHHRTGWEWNIYPTYDFACPIVDSLEGVTHALRTTEYADRNEQYHWFLNALDIRRVNLWEFSRINFIRTFLSKRKLSKVVDSGKVSGWDDPRMPTVRGILRRGLTTAALREFMVKQGPSRNIVNMDWHALWAINKRILDPVVPRFTAIEKQDAILATLTGGPEAPYYEDRPRHQKNPDVGTKPVRFSSKVWLEQVDVLTLAPEEEFTLMQWGNAIVKGLDKASAPIKELQLQLHLEGDFKKTEKKITWLSENPDLLEVELWDFDYLITKDSLDPEDNLDDFLNPKTESMSLALCDPTVKELKAGEFLQLERKGYFRVDKAAGEGPEGRAVLFKVPAGGK